MARADEGGQVEVDFGLHDRALPHGGSFLPISWPVAQVIALHYRLVAHLCPISTPSFIECSSEGPKGARRVSGRAGEGGEGLANHHFHLVKSRQILSLGV